MNKKIIAVVFALIVIIAAVAVVWQFNSGGGDEDEGEKTISVVDYFGRTVTFDKSPERIIALGSSFVETLIYLDCFDNIICTNENTVSRLSPLYPDISSVDTVASMNPSTTSTIEYCVEHGIELAVVWGYSSYQEGINLMESSGINVIALNPKSLDDVYSAISLLGTVMDKEEKATSVVQDMKDTISDIEQKAKDIAGNAYGEYRRVYIELDSSSSGSYSSTSPCSESITATMLNILGVDYIGKSTSGTSKYFQDEEIIAYAPDYMVYMGPRDQSEYDILREGKIGPNASGWSNENTTVVIYDSESNVGFNGNWASATPSVVEGL